MTDALRTAISGLNDSTLRVANAISNMVNASSTGRIAPDGKNSAFQPLDVVATPNAVGGVTSNLVPRSPASFPVPDPHSPNANAQGLVAAPNVDLVAETTAIITAQATYAANAKVIRAVDEANRKLLDTLA